MTGDDTIYLGRGRALHGYIGEWTSGGPGHDTIYGQAGLDEIEAGEGNDVVRGGPGHDELSGGDGDDSLIGGPNPDFLSGDRLHQGVNARVDANKETVDDWPSLPVVIEGRVFDAFPGAVLNDPVRAESDWNAHRLGGVSRVSVAKDAGRHDTGDDAVVGGAHAERR